MKYFKDAENNVFAFEADGSQDEFIPEGLTQVTEAQADALRFPAPSRDQQKAAAVAAIQAQLDNRAALLGYDNIVSACSYAAQPVGAPFQAEGAAFLAWRSEVWSVAYAEMAALDAKGDPVPTPAEAVASMPELQLP